MEHGGTLRPSTIITKIKNIYEKLSEQSDVIHTKSSVTTKRATFEELLLNIRKFYDKEEIDSIWFDVYKIYQNDKKYNLKLQNVLKGLKYTNRPEKINKKNIEKLYGNTLHTTISRLEQYKRCAFAFYLKYGLKISKKTMFAIESMDTGSFMHDVIDEFFDQIIQRDIKVTDITEELMQEIVENIINEKLTLSRNYIFTSTPKYILLTNRLKRVILKSMGYIIQTLKQSDFKIWGNEVEFNNDKKYKPIEIELEDGKKVELTGKIDRIDLAQNKEGKYIRIIDYKSSIKKLDLNEVIAGLQIQLLTYLDAVTQIEDVIPAGILYFNLIDPIIKANKNMTDEEIEKEIKKQFKMQGLILADVNIIRMMDNTLKSGSSSIIPAYITTEESISQKKSSVVTKEQFDDLQKYTKKLIKQIAKEILTGSIDISPSYNSKKKKASCEYCEYKSICNFDKTKNSYNYIPNLQKDIILDDIKEKNEVS